MKTFSNDPAMREAFIAEVRRHYVLDHLTKGIYGVGAGDRWRGCAVGCAAVSWAAVRGIEIATDDHAALEREGLYPEWLARLEDTLFEGLPDEKSMEWPLRLSMAIPVGADIEPVKWRFCAFLMRENIDRVLGLDLPETLKTQVVDAIQSVFAVCETAAATGELDESAAESARSAQSAAGSTMSVSRSAESVESAARSARLAAWSAARSARFAAWSAKSAARSVSWAAKSAAESAAYERYADELIAILLVADASKDK